LTALSSKAKIVLKVNIQKNMATKSSSNSASKKAKSLGHWQHFNIFAGLFFVLAFALVTTLSAYTSMAAKPGPTLTTPNLSLTPVTSSTTRSMQVWSDSGTQIVNAVQANITYPIDKLNFVSIDTTNSAYGVEAVSKGGNGVIDIERGSATPLSGRQLIATINFTSLSTRKTTASVNFTSGSLLLSATSNTNVLAATYGSSFSL
jgi:hypothetical protein